MQRRPGTIAALALVLCSLATLTADAQQSDPPERPQPRVKITLGPVPKRRLPSLTSRPSLAPPRPDEAPAASQGLSEPTKRHAPSVAVPARTTHPLPHDATVAQTVPGSPDQPTAAPFAPSAAPDLAPGRAAPAPADADTAPRILAPTQGRPIFALPGNAFTCLLHVPEGEPPRLFLRSSLFPELRYPLLPRGSIRTFGEGYAGMDMTVPASAPEGLYDLVLAVAGREVVNRHSVSVVREFKTRFRFVHLSNMNVGDPTAVDFDPRLPEEINLLAPEFIVATGDYTEWARLCDHPADWQRVLDYMARFEAPVYLLCGDHDHQASFTRHVANSPVGTIDYGNYHGLLLLDHGYHPIARDDDQVRWVLQDLEANRGRTFNFVVAHSDELGLIQRLCEMGIAEKAVRDFKLRMIICGGHSDWDYREFSSLLIGLPGLHYIRTGQSSTAVRDKALGESRYRVIEVNGERINYVYPADYFDPRIQYSVPAGRIRTTFAGPNDGSQDVVTMNVANALNRSWEDCRVWLRVRKDPARPMPAVAGGTLLRCLDAGTSWACEVGFDLPDKGAVTVQAGPADQIAPPLPVRLEFSCPDHLAFTPRSTAYDLTWFTCPSPAILSVINESSQPVTVWPIVRLNGTNLSLSGAGPEPLPLTVPARSSQMLRINLTLGYLALGPHTLQAFLLDDPLRRLTTQPVMLLLSADQMQTPTPASRPAATQPTAAWTSPRQSP